MFDSENDQRWDARTENLRPGTRTPPSRNLGDILYSVAEDYSVLMHNGLAEGPEHEEMVKLCLLGEMIISERFNSTSIEAFAIESLKDACESLDAAAPQYTYYGEHKKDAGNIGVWLDRDEIAKAIEEKRLIYIKAEHQIRWLVATTDKGKYVLDARNGDVHPYPKNFNWEQDGIGKLDLTRARSVIVEYAETVTTTSWTVVDGKPALQFQAG